MKMGPSKRKGSVRRPVLDLNAREDSPSRPTWQTKYQLTLPGEESHQNGDSQTLPSSTQSNPLSGLLGSYNSDSDNEESTLKAKRHLDAKVEDFLKEIQSLTVETSSSIPNETVTHKPQVEESVQYPPSVTAWQQCYDHNSGYPYYWNTETNEVTWEMPADLKAAIASVAAKQLQQQQKLQTQKVQPQSQPQPQPEVKKKIIKYPWQTESDSEDEKIEMITSFGPQSDEESDGEQNKTSGKSKKNTNTVGPHSSKKSFSSKIKNKHISPAPEDLEGMNENSYETSSLLTHGVQDTGPPGDESFQTRKDTVTAVKINKVPESSKKEPSVNLLTTDNLKNQITDNTNLVNEAAIDNKTIESVLVEAEDSNKSTEVLNDNKSPNKNPDIADEVIAQIEKETPPDYNEDSNLNKLLEPQKPDSIVVVDSDSQNSTNLKMSSFALIANYGDDSESEDNNISEKRKNNSKLQTTTSKPLFPIEMPEEKVKPLFPCIGAETVKPVNDQVKEASEENPEPVSNIYKMELELNDPVVQKAFKRKKRIEFATTIYGPSTSKAKVQESTPSTVVFPTTQYNLDPESNTHQGFGFNALKMQENTEKKTYTKYGGIQFIKAETLNLNEKLETKTKAEGECDSSSAPGSSSKETVKDEEIEDAATLLKEKLIFLYGGKEEISPIQQMTIELETLVSAWQHGALTPPYLMRWLNEKSGEINRHEKSAAPPGWTCLWDRKSKRYFYRNTTTKAIQWEYPNVEEKSKTKETESCGDEMEICNTPPHLSPTKSEKLTDETPTTPPPPVISEVSNDVSPPSPTPQPPPPPQISFSSENDPSAGKTVKKKKRKADEMSTSIEGETEVATIVPSTQVPNTENLEAAPPLPPMPPPPPPPPNESPPPLPDSPPPLPLDPDQPLPPGVDEPEYAIYRAPKHSYKKTQADSAAYSAEMMMTYGYGLPVASGGQPLAMPMQPMDYTYMQDPLVNPYVVQSPPTSHVIHCPAKKPKPSLTAELVSFYSDLAMLDSTPSESNSSSASHTAPPPIKPQEPAPPPPVVAPQPPAPIVTKVSHTSNSSVVSSSSTAKPPESVTSNGINVKKKKKAKTTTGLALKKKGVSSLVAKWQQVQQEVRKDFSDEDDEDDVAPSK